MKKENRYYVDYDYQGGEFGTGRDYTIRQWQKQALEWCFADDSVRVATEILTLQEDQILPYIAEFWDIHFRKTRKDKKIKQSNIDDFKDESLVEFYMNRFIGEERE